MDDASSKDFAFLSDKISGFRDLKSPFVLELSSVSCIVTFNFILSNNLSRNPTPFGCIQSGIMEDGNQKLAGTIVLFDVGISVIIAEVLVARFLKSVSRNTDFFAMNMLGSTTEPKGPNISGKYSFLGLLAADFVADVFSIICGFFGQDNELGMELMSSTEEDASMLLLLREKDVLLK